MELEKRSYHQFCGIAKALDIIGERWTLLILRDLLLGPRRYKDFLEGLPGITTNLLAKRLKEMEANGLIQKIVLASPASGEAYALTELGKDLEPALLALGKWGARYLGNPIQGDTLNIAWGLISLKRRYHGVEHPVTIELKIGGRIFQYRLTKDYADVREGTPWLADMTISGASEVFRSLLFMNASARELISSNALALETGQVHLNTFLQAFALQE